MQIKSHFTSTYLTFNNISSNSISIQILIVNNSAISYLKLLNVIIIMHNTFHDSQYLMKDNKVTKNSTQWKIYKVTKKNRLDIELQVKHILQHTIQGQFKQAVNLDTWPFDTCVKYCFFWRTGGSHLSICLSTTAVLSPPGLYTHAWLLIYLEVQTEQRPVDCIRSS